MQKLGRILDNIEKYLLFFLLGAMTIIIGFQVFGRFVLHNSLSWSEEVARYMLVWTTFIGASLGVKQGAHIGVEAFTLLLPKKARKVVNNIAYILCAIFTSAIFVQSLGILQKQISSHQVSPAVQMPMWIPYAALPVGMLLMTLRFIECLVNSIKKSEIKSEDTAVKAVEKGVN